MNEGEYATALSLIAFIAFVLLLVIGLGTTLLRARRYSNDDATWPSLMARDIIAIGGLGLNAALILGARVLGIGSAIARDPIWVTVTSTTFLVSIGVYTYYELRVIERPPKKPGE